ncbi:MULTISPECIES: hypothetical protein [unclassified Streptomyces]|uniref:hypothetical protein n=1 Tax=unclassified Streptomyces TaxID=2593676 RepID=UPI0037FBB4D0
MVFAQFVEGLLAELPRKNGWTLSERAGHATEDRMQCAFSSLCALTASWVLLRNDEAPGCW